MFLTRLIRWVMGWIRFEAEGGFPERLLNLAAAGQADLWNIRQNGIILSACIPSAQYRRLRRPARRAGMRLRVRERHGAPFFVYKWRKRSGILVGLILFSVVINMLSVRTWVIEVRGNERVDSDIIKAVMEEYGVREGADLSGMDVEKLQLDAMSGLPELSWFMVNLAGSTAYIDVKERDPAPELSDDNAPTNIVALRDGQIISVEVYAGQSLVLVGDAVAQGRLLVSGIVESKVGPIFRRSKAKIMAKTEREIEVEVLLTEELTRPSGKVVLRPYVRFFSWNIPLFSDGPIAGETSLVTSKHPVTVNGIPLPIGMVNQTYERLERVVVTRTPEQAERLAAQMLDELEISGLAGVEILSSARSGIYADNRYILTGKYECIEDIAYEEPILVD